MRVFYSYASADEDYRQQLEKHLSILKRTGAISDWHFRKILPGHDWKEEISDALGTTQLFLPLISADFLASDYCYDVELERALEMREEGSIEIVPIVVRPVDITGSPLESLQMLPQDARPVSVWDNADEAWKTVSVGIRAVCENISALSPDADQEKVEKAADAADYGILDFQADFFEGMQNVGKAQVLMTEKTKVATVAMQEHGERMKRLDPSKPKAFIVARSIATSMGRDLGTLAKDLLSIAGQLEDAWDRVDNSFPKVLRPPIKSDSEENAKLRDTLVEAQQQVEALRKQLLATEGELLPLGDFSSDLKASTRKTREAILRLAQTYWKIENSLGRMSAMLGGSE